MLVEVYSDVVCPWCYVGKRRFERALGEFEGRDDVEVVFRPFQLDPDAPRQATPVLDAYARKFGGPERAFEIIQRMTAVAEAEGLEFHLDTAVRVNTFDAHRLIGLATDEGLGPEMKERLLRAYFTESRDVGDHTTLTELAAEVGLDPARVGGLLDSDEGAEAVRDGLRRATDLDIHAVPTYVIDGEWMLAGAQDPELFLKVLRRAEAAATNAT